MYGHEGAFDTVVAPAPTPAVAYVALEAGEFNGSSTDKPYAVSVNKSASGTDNTYYSTNRGSQGFESMHQPSSLFLDAEIVAARVPMDKIVLGECLSSGGFGEVYKGTYKSQLVAIKRMLPQHRQEARLVEKFLAEVKLMASLEHERIVRFLGVAWESATDVMVLCEFMDGGDLRAMLKQLDTQKKPIGFDRTKIKIALHVAHALTYMHSLQPVVLHRDLKSSNILLSQDMDAKITDFGVSREHVDATMTRGVGTSLWMAPEIMMGGRYDEKADMFSFGVVLSELDSNKLPYADQVDLKNPSTNYLELMHDVSAGRLTVEFSYESDPEIVALGRSCVAVDPAQRPSAAEALHRVHQVLRHFDGLA